MTKKIHSIVTGCAGFIGSSLTDRLLSLGHSVTGIDNFSTGQESFIADALKNLRFQLVRGDLLDLPLLKKSFASAECVYHLAANADVRFGTHHPDRDLEQNTIATFNVLEAARVNGVSRIMFSSTGSIYGEAAVIPTPENAPFPVQTSLYGASKLAAEGLIQAYCEGFGMQSYIYRFVSILGERYTHGHVFDFYRQLSEDPGKLTVLGNGRQRKSYLYIQDCLDAILMTMEKCQDRVNIFNLGTDEYIEVTDSIQCICDYLEVSPELIFTGGDRGWIGDNPFIFLDCSKVFSVGWKPKLTIREAVGKTIQYLHENAWVMEARV